MPSYPDIDTIDTNIRHAKGIIDLVIDNIVLKDALLDFYTKAFCRGLEEFRENLERLEKERANETV